jgi:environmental stress-induced protein Ves
MKILRASNHKSMPWKNGGGETAEIAVFPNGASMQDFGWRVSMAKVIENGPFSLFPDVDRTLSILEGHSMALTIEDAETVVLTKESDPLTFPADAPVNATLPEGEIRDLNVMTRRGSFTHSVSRIAQPESFHVTGGETIIIVASGTINIRSGENLAQLQHLDCALLDIEDRFEIAPSTKGSTGYLVTITQG